jgi:hypothetical protein
MKDMMKYRALETSSPLTYSLKQMLHVLIEEKASLSTVAAGCSSSTVNEGAVSWPFSPFPLTPHCCCC